MIVRLIPFVAVLVLVLAAFAIRIARPPVEPRRTVTVTIAVDAGRFIAALATAAAAADDLAVALREAYKREVV